MFFYPAYWQEMPTEVATLCFHTLDAERRAEGEFSFNLPNNRLRTNAVKMTLASCEFPMVQQTIEKEWNRFYYSEEIRITPDMSTMNVVLRDFDDENSEYSDELHTIRLPLWVNSARCAKGKGNAIIVETEFPHNLVSSKERLLSEHSILMGCEQGDFEIIQQNVEYMDEKTFVIIEGCADLVGHAILHTPCTPTPRALATALRRSCAEQSIPLLFSYDDKEDQIGRAHV